MEGPQGSGWVVGGPTATGRDRSAVAYYLIVGAIGPALAGWFALSTLETIAGGFCDRPEGWAILCRSPRS